MKTPFKAIKNNDLENTKYRLEQGANLRVDGDYKLRLATENGRLEVDKCLLERREDSNLVPIFLFKEQAKESNQQNKTPLCS